MGRRIPSQRYHATMPNDYAELWRTLYSTLLHRLCKQSSGLLDIAIFIPYVTLFRLTTKGRQSPESQGRQLNEEVNYNLDQPRIMLQLLK